MEDFRCPFCWGEHIIQIDDVLLANRDSQTDVGRGLVIDAQHKRTDIKDCFVAACKRITEALRVLAEVPEGCRR